jgi:acetyl-CoA carboxylase biotin carboxyl carrier protein
MTCVCSNCNAMAKTPLDSELVRALAELLAETDLTEIELEKGDLRIRVARTPAPITHYVGGGTPAAPAPSPAPAPTPAPIQAPGSSQPTQAASNSKRDTAGALPSPMVGTVYLRASPDSKAFVDLGTPVNVGDKILLIEAMKTFNEITATKAGIVTGIWVEDGQPVEYGEPLITIE